MSTQIVFPNRDNSNSAILSETLNGVTTVFDFSSVTRMICQFEGSIVEADTDIDPTLIDYSPGLGEVVFNFDGLAIDKGAYKATLIEFDPAHPQGQVLAHPIFNDLTFIFV